MPSCSFRDANRSPREDALLASIDLPELATVGDRPLGAEDLATRHAGRGDVALEAIDHLELAVGLTRVAGVAVRERIVVRRRHTRDAERGLAEDLGRRGVADE